MEITILNAIVPAAAVLLGVALTSYVNLRTLRRNHEFQYASQHDQRQHERREQRRTEALQRLTNAHKGLSAIAREFSPTNLDIIWRSKVDDLVYDKQYLLACCEMDELRAFAAIYEPSLISQMESVHGQMNIFWGNFKEVLRLSALGEKVDYRTSCFEKAHAATQEIGAKTTRIKEYVTLCASKYVAEPDQLHG